MNLTCSKIACVRGTIYLTAASALGAGTNIFAGAIWLQGSNQSARIQAVNGVQAVNGKQPLILPLTTEALHTYRRYAEQGRGRAHEQAIGPTDIIFGDRG